ncbi:hypothetical protein BLNAU_16549 [Blattamonas nauphoetae]|uniref:Uncharacterized protein n=1 Tax=Blattamonas nauphoetae TaxID=2049346 RepID=A0ABQ9XB75_9EUKA|nr:hypothetical protein BLNAU_16549 [Blattamonas nauphoetae]
MIGSCVSRSTNHLYGTGIRDLNLGGSVLCSNTSFTQCTTNYENKQNTTQTRITTANTLHLFSLCTFKGCASPPSYPKGGAIHNNYTVTDLEIASCSFDSCSAPNGNGGAVSFIQEVAEKSVVISSSSFVNCRAGSHTGGSLYLNRMKSLSISDCQFLHSAALHDGAAMCIYNWHAEPTNARMSNCLFRNCTSESMSSAHGGTIRFTNCTSIRLDSVSFRECVAGSGNGPDLRITQTSPAISLSTVSYCDSTSTPKEKRIHPTDLAEGVVLPNPTDTTTILSLVVQPTVSTTAEIVVTLDKTVTGSLLVLVSNSEGTGRTDTTKAPNIGRVLLFSIDSSNTGRCTVSIGETGLLQLPLEEYKIVDASLSSHIVSFSDVWIYVRHPTMTSAECVLDENSTHALLHLEGIDLEAETFELTLQNGKTLEATFSENKTTIDLGMIGESSGWMENEEFVITNGTWKDDSSIIVAIPSQHSFIIPEAARLTDIEVSDLNEEKTEVRWSFSSRLLKPEHNYTITLERKDGNERIVIDVRTLSSGLLADETVKLYPSNKNVEGWKNLIGYGKEYEVIDMSAKAVDGDYPILFSPITVTTPEAPALVKSAERSTDQPTTTIVQIEGSGLIQNETYTLTLSGKPASNPLSLDVHSTTISVVALSSTEAKSLSLALSTTSESSLLFGHKYTITAITNGSVTGIVEGTPSFTTRFAPTLKSVYTNQCSSTG